MRLSLTNTNKKLLVALVIAVGLVAAFSTFAAAPNTRYATQWNATGRQAVLCTPKHGKERCGNARDGISKVQQKNGQITFVTSKLQAGMYHFKLRYRNFGRAAPADPYKYFVTVKVNGRAVDRDRLPARRAPQTYTGEKLELRNGANRIDLYWHNAVKQPKLNRDANIAWQSIFLHRMRRQPPAYMRANQLSRVYARKILQSNKIRLRSGAKRSVLAAANNNCAPVPAAGACTKLDRMMLRALYVVSQRNPITVTSMTTGTHSSCSNHYQGRAIDIISYSGSSVPSRSLLAKYRQYGASELLGPGDPDHSDHLHVAWEGPNRICSGH